MRIRCAAEGGCAVPPETQPSSRADETPRCPGAGAAAPRQDGASVHSPRVSVIVPMLNEASTIDALQDQLESFLDAVEVLLVDGGSTDGTLEAVRPGFRVVSAPRGRGAALNAGARASSGAVLFFLHADSVLPDGWLGELERVAATHRWGCFGVRFPVDNVFKLTCRIVSNHRAKRRRIVFGDQGMFIDRTLFFELGGFPDIPLMEDYQFSLTCRARGYRVGMARRRILTSDRRLGATAGETWRAMCSMVRLRRLYRQGVSPDELAKRYVQVR